MSTSPRTRAEPRVTGAPGPTAGHAVVAQLERLGVERVYCVPGESYLEVLDGLRDSPIRTVVCRQEGGAGFMAVADSRLTGRLGVALVTRGPGAANATIAVHTAWQDGTAMLLLVGLVPLRNRHRQAFQDLDLTGWFGTTAKAVVTLDTPERAGELLADAAHLARSGRPGPVVVGLPEDVLLAPGPAGSTAPRALAEGGADPHDVEAVAGTLARADRPLLVVGGERWTAEAAADLAAWAESAEVPVVADFRTQDVLDNASGAYAGWLGFDDAGPAARLLDRADAVCFVGCGNTDVPSGGYTRGADGRHTVLVHPDPALRAHAGGVDRHLLCAPGPFTAALRAHPAPPAGPRGRERHRTWYAPARAAQEAFTAAHADRPGRGVDLAVAMDLLRRRLRPDAVVTYGAGNHALWAMRYLTHHRYPSLLAPRNGAMGFDVPAGVAACVAEPDRQVVTVTGDGCFLMNGQELATAAAEGAAPLVVVVDDGQYGTIRRHQERAHPGRVSGTALHNPDFAAYARAFGGFGATASTTDEVGPALDAALSAGTLAVVHLRTDPDVLRPT